MSERIPIVPPAEADLDFVSGPKRPDGMGVRYFLVGDVIEGAWTASPLLEGWSGLVHGTAFAALHDEAAIYAIVYLASETGFTTRIDTRFRRPIRIGERVVVRARVAKVGERGATVASEIVLADGAVASTAETDYAFADEAALLRVLGRPLSPFLAGWIRAPKAKRLGLAIEWSRERTALAEGRARAHA